MAERASSRLDPFPHFACEQAWRHVLAQELVLSPWAEWVLKLDADAVVHGPLLRELLASHDSRRPLLLTTPAERELLERLPFMRPSWGRHGILQGAIEALSRPAVTRLVLGLDGCLATGNASTQQSEV